MAEGFSRGRAGPSTSAGSSQSTDAALSLHNLIDRTCVKINELKQLMIEECNIVHQDFSDELLEPVLARQDAVIQRAMKCIQAQQKALTSDNGLNRRSGRGQMPPLSASNENKHLTMAIPEPRPSPPVFGARELAVSPKEKKWRMGDKGKKLISNQNTSPALTSNVSCLMSKLSTVNIRSVGEDPNTLVSPHQEDCLDGENSAWYGSLDRNVARKKKRQGLDKSRRHTKTVGSTAGLNIAERCEKLRPDEHYEIGLPSISMQRGSLHHTASLAKNRPPLPTPYFSPTMEIPQRPFPTNDSDFTSKIVKDSYKNRVSPVDSIIFGSHLSTPSPHGYPKNAPMGMSSPDWYGNSTIHSKSSQQSKSWFETNLDEGKLCSPLTSTIEPSSSLSVVGVDNINDNNINRMYIASPGTDISEKSSKSSDSETRCSFTNESSKPFEMSDYYKYSTKFRSSSSSVLPRDATLGSRCSLKNSVGDLSQLSLSSSALPKESATSTRSAMKTSFGEVNQLKKGRVVAVNINDELKFTVEEPGDSPEDSNGNYFTHDTPVPKLPPKQSSFNGPHQVLTGPLDPMDGNDMAWFLDFDPPTFV